MRTTWKLSRKNPFRVSFFAVTVICCIALSIVFYYISYMNNKATREKYAQEKAEVIMSELEMQLQLMENVALNIVSNYEFQPYYFKVDVAKELSMLKTFQQYKYQISLAEEYFLDYGGTRIYKSSGGSRDFDMYIREKSENAEEQKRFREELLEIREEVTKICGDPKVLSIFDGIYVLIPLKVNEGTQYTVAILGFVVQKSALEERFRIASGGIEGEMTLYGEDGILYSNQEEPCSPGQKNVITAVSQNGHYTFCYRPKKEFSMQSGMFLLQILLVLCDAFLVFIIANIFAEKTYKPIQILADKYRGEISEKKKSDASALEELGYMMDTMWQSNIESNLQIQENQKIIRTQVLKMIINGSASWELQSYLEKAQIYLPGPIYCVISISFEEEQRVTKEFLGELQEELEQIPDANEKEYIYIICSYERKILNVICSIPAEEGKEEFVETVCDVAESFEYKPLIGIGNAYQELSNLSASWLESMDAIQCERRKCEKEEQGGFVYDAEELRRILAVLESGNEEAALKKMEGFVEELYRKPMSMLMLQYILADFLGEIRKLGEKYRIDVSRRNISLLISAKNARDFEGAAKKVIHEFSERYEAVRSQAKEEESKQICEYIEAHFAEYDISSESVAAYFHVNRGIVRQAVLEHTGKLYRDYIIYLRIEYAKQLLRQENIPVAELCQKVGYGNVSYFVKLFREVTGVTPSKYRNMVSDK